MTEMEIELTFLAKDLPKGLASCRHVAMEDIYLPSSAAHPQLRLRRQGEKYMITKKTPVKEGDASMQTEETIVLSEAEYESLRGADGKHVSKTRYYVPYNDLTAEIDVFSGELSGLVVVDFEFTSEAEKLAFVPPAFCGPDVTQEGFIAGGLLAGRSYADIRGKLDRLGYHALSVDAL